MTTTISPDQAIAQAQAALAKARAAKAQATRRAARAAAGFHLGDRVQINTPGSPKFHGRTATVTAEAKLGEVGVSFTRSDNTEAYFTPKEMIKL